MVDESRMRKDLKRLGITASVAAAIGGGILGGALPAWAAPSSDALRFPITLWDYNADNILFEYDRGWDATDSAKTYSPLRQYSGNGKYGLLAHLGTTGDKDLVEPELGANGLPVYKRSTVEAAARAMALELLDTDYMRDYEIDGHQVKQSDRFYSLRGQLAGRYTGVSDAAITKGFGNGGVSSRFYDEGWNAEGGSTQVDGKLMTAPKAWDISTYGTLKAYGEHAGALTKTLEVKRPTDVSDQAYELVAERGQGGREETLFAQMDVQVTVDGEVVRPYAPLEQKAENDYDHGVLRFDIKTADQAGTSAAAKVEISFRPHAAATADDVTAGELRVIRLHAASATDEAQDIWRSDSESSAFAGNWTVPAGLVLNGDTVGGTELWYQDGDGIKSAAGNTTALTRRVPLHAGQLVRIRYWNENQTDVKDPSKTGSLTVKVMSKDGQKLFEDDGTVTGWVEGSFVVPGGIGDASYVDLSVAPSTEGAGSGLGRVAALELTPEGVASVGNYDETVARFADGTKGLSDVTTCMDYCYYMLNNLWSDNNASIKAGDFENIYLDEVGDPDATDDGAATGKSDLRTFKAGVTYAGTDENKVVYDKKSHSIYNDTENGTDNAGFFPLDDRGENDRTGVIERDGKQLGGAHNYNFAMAGSSKFVYHKGAGQVFKFAGDDDTYLFINGKLALDLGGAHTTLEGEVSLDDRAQELGLEDGGVYSFKFFYLERHTDESNLMISTNIELVGEDEDPTAPSNPERPENPGQPAKPTTPTQPATDRPGSSNDSTTKRVASTTSTKTVFKKTKGGLVATGDTTALTVGALVTAGGVLLGIAWTMIRRARN